MQGRFLLLAILLAGSALTLACREAEPGGRRRLESEAREQTVTRAGAIQAASCDELSCNAPATCELREDAPSCVCPSGSRLATDGRGCEDIDECKEASTHDCDVNADCKNRERGYDCTCREGYAGDGRSCVAADSCKDDQTT